MFVAGFTIARTLRLETELQQRYVELQELSARLLSAQEEERRAISRELHDEVGQSLSALLMEAGNAAATVPLGQRGGLAAHAPVLDDPQESAPALAAVAAAHLVVEMTPRTRTA